MTSAPAQVRPRPPRAWPRRAAIATGVAAFTIFAGLEVGFSPTQIADNFSAANRIIGEFWPPNWQIADNLVEPYLETIQTAIIGTILGCLLAIPVAFLASRATSPNRAVLFVGRSVMNVLRTMPDLFWAMLFTAAIGFNAFAGAVALTVFAMVIMAKLFSETIDAVDLGPYEAVRATGAGWFSSVQQAVLPQVLPNYVAYALYIFELLIRSAVVLGLVGAGGVGEPLDRYRQFFQYGNVMVIVLITLAIVLLLEAVSAFARKRLV